MFEQKLGTKMLVIKKRNLFSEPSSTWKFKNVTGVMELLIILHEKLFEES